MTADGSSTGVFVNGSPYGIRNDGGTLADGGTIASAKFNNSPLTTDDPVTVVSGVNNSVATTDGVWNNNNGATIMRATSTIAGLPSTAMTSAASAGGQSILQAATIRVRLYKAGIRAGDWNEFTGKWSSDPAVVYSGGWNSSGDVDNSTTLVASGTDVAANPTQDIPGYLTFFSNSGNMPSTQPYAKRYLW